jgi:nitronate monooxygenase
MSTELPEPRRGWTRNRFTRLAGIPYPIVQGPFGGGRSTAQLTAAVTNAGGLGSFGAHELDPDGIAGIARDIRRLTSGPFALNLWVPLAPELEPPPTEEEFASTLRLLQPMYQALAVDPPRFAEVVVRTEGKFEQQVEAVLAAKPAVFSFIFGIPSAAALEECRRRGIVTLGTATNVVEGLALEAAGVDAIVASGSEAGGHRASWLRPAAESPAISALVPQVVDRVRLPVVAAGGIVDGRGAVAAMTLGAEGVQVGTAFLASPESGASPAHKTRLTDATERSTMLSRVFTGRFARGLVNQGMRELLPSESTLPAYPWQSRMMAPLTRAAASTGNSDMMALWAGQNAALVSLRPAAETMAFLINDIDRVLEQIQGLSR